MADDIQAAADAAPGGTGDAPARPDWLPEKFWDPDAATPRVEDLGKSYLELERNAGELKRKVGAKKEEWQRELEAERLAGRPEKPEAYEPKLPEELAAEWQIREDDPLLGWWRGFAFERGLDQEAFNGALEQFVRWQAGNQQQQVQALEAELGKLGEQGARRVQHVELWLKGKVGDEAVKALDPLLGSAAAIEALEKLMESVGERRLQPSDAGAAPSLDQEKLDQMVKDPRYWRDREPGFVRQVTEGFAKLYSGTMGGARR